MNREELTKLLDAVDQVNEQLYIQLGDDTTNLLYVTVEPYIGIVMVDLGKQHIWDSDNDGREWIEAGPSIKHDSGICTDDIVPAHYESWDSYLRKKINQLVADIAKIKL